jgi:hypothetical protein
MLIWLYAIIIPSWLLVITLIVIAIIFIPGEDTMTNHPPWNPNPIPGTILHRI